MDRSTALPMTRRPLLPLNDAARILCVSPRTLRALCAEGKIQVVRVSARRIAIDPDDLDRYISDQRR